MNVETTIGSPRAVGLTAGDFLLLKKSGAFAEYYKSELIEGQLYGVLLEMDDDAAGDEIVPIGLRVEDYALLADADAFASCGKTELVDGVVYEVSPQFSEHMKAKVRLLRRLADACDALGSGLEAWSEGAIQMAPSSMPEPDIFITTATPTSGPVIKETVALIVEISDTSLAFDLGDKAALYARNGVPEYWVVDIVGRVIHQHWSPSDNGYRETCQIALGDDLKAKTIAELIVDMKGI